MIDNSLLMGIVLIGVGIALALIAYAVMLNRRDGEEPGLAEAEQPAVEEEAERETGEEVAEPLAAPAETAAPPPVIAAPLAPPIAAAPPPAGSALSTPPRRLLPVASLFREDVTGDLVVQVGERVYRRAEDLRGSPDASRVQSASSDLTRWLAGSAAAKPSAPAREEPPAKPGSMIDQINHVLEEKLSANAAARGVRLAEGPGGVVRVFIGVHSYPMDEVPDPEVRQLIRQAVAEWEARG